MSVSYRRMVRFGPGTISILLVLTLMGAILAFFGVTRTLANIEGGGTLLLLGAIILLADVFLIVGIATTRITRVEKRYHHLPSLVGKKGVVKSSITGGGRGVVLVDNELWTATSEEELGEGTVVKIINIQGVILSVSRDV